VISVGRALLRARERGGGREGAARVS
jgi:hypothetical protein